MGADLKNTITLVAGGQAFMSHFIGDLSDYRSLEAYRRTVLDWLTMYEIQPDELLVVHDAHPEYVSTMEAGALKSRRIQSVQHHRAHIASVLAEREAWEERVIGVSFDGTGYGDDGAIWGGEIFEGSIAGGFQRIAHLRYASLPGGDAAAQHPVQAAAGYLQEIDDLPALASAPFHFPDRYESSLKLLSSGIRTFRTSSAGRLFDTAAALVGFTRPVTFEGQAAAWLEQLALRGHGGRDYPFPFDGKELDFRPVLHAMAADRLGGWAEADLAMDFHRAVAQGLCEAIETSAERFAVRTVVLSGGVFQNDLLLGLMRQALDQTALQLWTNRTVPPNDGGISLGQAAMAAFDDPVNRNA
jgi:hydrogenase maturation protein HypF